MKHDDYKGYGVTTHARERDGRWRGAYQIDGEPIVTVDDWPVSFDELSAHADALGHAMWDIDGGLTQRIRGTRPETLK